MEGPPPPPLEPPPIAPVQPAPTGPRPSNAQILVMLTVASLLLVIGLAMLQARELVATPVRSDYPSSEAYDTALRTFRGTMRVLGFVGVLLVDLAAGLVLLGGFMVGLGRSDLPDSLRRSMVVMGVVLAAIWLILYIVFGGLLTSFP